MKFLQARSSKNYVLQIYSFIPTASCRVLGENKKVDEFLVIIKIQNLFFLNYLGDISNLAITLKTKIFIYKHGFERHTAQLAGSKRAD